jgi:hypothetical protein
MTGTGITLTITNNSTTATGLTLGSGSNLFIGSTNILDFTSTQATGITNNGGTIASTGTNGIDGGTIRINTCCGGGFTIGGTAGTTVYNLQFLQNATFNISGPSLRINGTFTIPNNNWNWNGASRSPIYGPASTLYINRTGQGLNSGASPLDKAWSAQSGTIGVTEGYPNNVTIVNIGTSNGSVNVPPNVNVGWAPSGTVGLNGTLRLGDGTNSAAVSLHNVTNFNSGGIIVDHNSVLVSPAPGATYINRGDFILQGATTGLYYNYGATINFAGSGTVASPQVISTTGASVQFTGMTVSNGTYVQLQDPVTVTSTLNLTSGYIGTSTTNSLTVTNTSNTAITGGSSTAYVDGPLTWSLPANPSGNYVFPVGDRVNNGGAYLPFTINSASSTSGTNVTVRGFNLNSGGTPDPTISSISPTEYWSVTTTNPITGSPVINVSRPNAVAPYNSLGRSSMANGIYTAIGGTPGGNTINGGGLGSSTPAYITIVNAFLNVVRVGGAYATVDANCNLTTGSLIVGGVGGTPPYTFSVDGSPFSATTTYTGLAVGPHTVIVRDATTATSTATLKVLGPVQINGNDQDVDICVGQSVTLTASNMLNSSPTYVWSPGGATTPSITVSPATATTYTVTSTVYANNLITNGSFESGTPGGFVAGYTAHAGGYGTTPGNGGFYKIANAGNSLCTFFTALPAQDGTNYYIADGNTASTDIFSLNITGLTIGVNYRFSFWYAKGSPTAPHAQIRTSVGATVLGTVIADNHTAWTQVIYNFTASATTATITLRNMLAPGNTDGNDFFIDNMMLQSPCTISTSVNVTTNCTLPVELVFFNAVRQGEGALLTWTTAGEINSSHFIIEKSTDGISFTSVRRVNAAGNSSDILQYSLTDPSIGVGVTYYRLVQYDLDGTAHYSEVRAVSREGIASVQVIPNPNNGLFVILLDNSGDVQSRVSIVNSIGQIVFDAGESSDPSRNIDISHFASGVYYLQISTDENIIVKKVVRE